MLACHHSLSNLLPLLTHTHTPPNPKKTGLRLPSGCRQHRHLHRPEPPLRHHLGCARLPVCEAVCVGRGVCVRVCVCEGVHSARCRLASSAPRRSTALRPLPPCRRRPPHPTSTPCRRQDHPNVGVRHPGAGQVHCGCAAALLHRCCAAPCSAALHRSCCTAASLRSAALPPAAPARAVAPPARAVAPTTAPHPRHHARSHHHTRTPMHTHHRLQTRPSTPLPMPPCHPTTSGGWGSRWTTPVSVGQGEVAVGRTQVYRGCRGAHAGARGTAAAAAAAATAPAPPCWGTRAILGHRTAHCR